MDPSTNRRVLVTAAVVSVLAVLLAAPANAYLMNEGGPATTSAPLVGNPGDGAVAAQAATRTEPLVAPGASDGIGTEAIVGLGASLALVVAIGALFFTVRHRRVALP